MFENSLEIYWCWVGRGMQGRCSQGESRQYQHKGPQGWLWKQGPTEDTLRSYSFCEEQKGAGGTAVASISSGPHRGDLTSVGLEATVICLCRVNGWQHSMHHCLSNWRNVRITWRDFHTHRNFKNKISIREIQCVDSEVRSELGNWFKSHLNDSRCDNSMLSFSLL